MSMGGKMVEVVCVTCGRKRYLPAAVRKNQAKRWRCLECRSKRRVVPKWRVEANLVRWHEIKKAQRDAGFPCLVVLDPLDPGGFTPGTTLNKYEVGSMLVNKTFTENTIVRDMQGKIYRYENGRMFRAGEKR